MLGDDLSEVLSADEDDWLKHEWLAKMAGEHEFGKNSVLDL